MSFMRARRRNIRVQGSLGRTNLLLPSLKEENEAGVVFRSSSESSSLSSARVLDDLLDPAQVELIKAREAMKKRKSDETLLALEKIQSRISYTIDEYEGRCPSIDVNLEAVEDTDHLYSLLNDPQERSKYQQKLTVFLVGYEEKCEDLEKVLGQLQDFFEEAQLGGMKNLLEEVEEEEMIDLDQATAELSGALTTAQNAVGKLVNIKKEINQLMNIVASYPGSGKGRNKMEKALMKAQSEVATFSKNLDEVQVNLEKSTKEASQLQIQLDAKTQEYAQLRKTADQVKLLQVGNEALKRDLGASEKTLQDSREELSNTKKLLMEKEKPSGTLDNAEKAKMEAELKEERSRYQDLMQEMKNINETHEKEIEALKQEHVVEEEEMKERFEEQLKSSTGRNLAGVEEGNDGEGSNDNVEAEDVSKLEEELVQADDDTSNLTEKQEEDDTTPSLNISSASIHEKEVSPVSSYISLPEKSNSKISLDVQHQLDNLKMEYEAKEKKMVIQVEEIKVESRKTIINLQSQLDDANSKQTSEDKFETEFSDLNDKFTEAQQLNDELNKKLSSLEDSIRQKEEELEQMREEIFSKDYKISTPPQQQSDSALSGLLMPDPTLPSAPARSPMESLSTMPLVAMDDILDGEPSSPSLISERSNMFPSIEQSVVSLDQHFLRSMQSSFLSGDGSCTAMQQLNSNLQQPGGVPYGLSMLAGSRLSHHSSVAQNGSISHKHPIVIEWGKAYDAFIKFKENLISMLSEHISTVPQLSSSIEELRNMEVHSMDKKQDPQGQITEMRFSLSLLLHQIEQTLQDCFALFATGVETGQTDPVDAIRSKLVAELEAKTEILVKKLKDFQKNHETAVEEYKNTITRLSSKLESSNIEISKLRKACAANMKEGTIMFTRLDSERNTKALETALQKEKISPTTFEELTSSMEDYLKIPGQRLAALTQRCQERTAAGNHMLEIYKEYPDPVQAANVVQKIAHFEKHRQKNFDIGMEKLGSQRNELAYSLTDTLTDIERRTKLFLIKPVFGASINRSSDLITPIPRSFPASRKCQVAADNARARQVYTRPHTGCSSRASTSQSNVKAIQSFLKSQRQPADPKDLISSLNTAYADSPSTSTPSSPPSRVKSSRQRAHNSLPHRQSIPTLSSSDGDWDVKRSQTWQEDPHEPTVSTNHHQLSFSKLMELDITRHRQPESLLGHVLPKLNQHTHNYTSINQHHHHRHTPSSPKLISLPEESSQVSATNSSNKDKNRVFQPIAVPSI